MMKVTLDDMSKPQENRKQRPIKVVDVPKEELEKAKEKAKYNNSLINEIFPSRLSNY